MMTADPLADLRAALDEYRALVRELRAELRCARAEEMQLRAAIAAIGQANGYGLDVPGEYDDGQDWVVNAGAIRACRRAVGENL